MVAAGSSGGCQQCEADGQLHHGCCGGKLNHCAPWTSINATVSAFFFLRQPQRVVCRDKKSTEAVNHVLVLQKYAVK